MIKIAAFKTAFGLGLGGTESCPKVFAPFGGFEVENALYAVLKSLAKQGAPAR